MTCPRAFPLDGTQRPSRRITGRPLVATASSQVVAHAPPSAALGKRVATPSSRRRVDGVEAPHAVEQTPRHRRYLGSRPGQEPHTLRGDLLRQPLLGEAYPSRRLRWLCDRRAGTVSTRCQLERTHGTVAHLSVWGGGQRIEALGPAKQQAFPFAVSVQVTAPRVVVRE